MRGIVLIGTIMTTIVVFMTVAATLALAPTHFASAAGYTDSQRAQMAVDIGLNYAQARLTEDLTWRGSPDSGPHETVRTVDESMVIVEDHGNVVGLIRFEPGDYGQFRIRFNYQDGAGMAGGLDEPSRPFLAEKQVGDFVVRSEFLPPFQAYLAIEGRAGLGFRDASLDAPNAQPNGLRISEKLAEVRLDADFTETLDAAAKTELARTESFKQS